jgi:hypothetical protein
LKYCDLFGSEINLDGVMPGWERSWIDGITERIFKMEFSTTVGRVEEVVSHPCILHASLSIAEVSPGQCRGAVRGMMRIFTNCTVKSSIARV